MPSKAQPTFVEPEWVAVVFDLIRSMLGSEVRELTEKDGENTDFIN